MESAHGSATDFNFNDTVGMDFVGFGMPQTYAKAEDNTSAFFFGDEGIDTTTSGSFGQQYEPLFSAAPQESSFGMQQNLAMDNTMSTSAWNPQQLSPNNATMNSFPPTPVQSFDSLYQPQFSSALGKRPLQLDVDYPQSKRHEAFSPFPASSNSVAGSSWALDTQPTPASSMEIGLSDEAADVCATWFNKYATLPSDRHIESLSQLTGEPASAIRNWFGQLLKQGMGGGHDSAYKSQTGFTQQDQVWGDVTESIGTETLEASCNHETSNDTTTSQPLRGGKKGCVPTNDPALLGRDSNKIYQCTRKCGKRYGRKCDWKRNEEEGYPSKSWICSLCTSLGVEKVKPCFRKYHFSQHFRNIHPALNADDYEEASVVYSETDFPRKCGFCRHRFTSRQDRIDHIADHFKAGKCMLDWSDNEDDNGDSDNTDDDDDRPSGDGFDNSKSFGQPPSKDPYGGPGSGYYGTGGSGNGFNDQQSSSGGFFQFQLAQFSDNGSRGSSPGCDQHIKSSFERANEQQQNDHSDRSTMHGQRSIHGRLDTAEGSDSDAVAGNAVTRALSSHRHASLTMQDATEGVVEYYTKSWGSVTTEPWSPLKLIQRTNTVASTKTEPPQHISLSSLDRGGARGPSSLLKFQLLLELVNQQRRESDKPILEPRDVFDLIRCSSPGGFIALLGQSNMDVDQCGGIYKTMATLLFGLQHSHTEGLTGDEASSVGRRPPPTRMPPSPIPKGNDCPEELFKTGASSVMNDYGKNQHALVYNRTRDDLEAPKIEFTDEIAGSKLKDSQIAAKLAEACTKISTILDNGHHGNWVSLFDQVFKEDTRAQSLSAITISPLTSSHLRASLCTLRAPAATMVKASDTTIASRQFVNENGFTTKSRSEPGLQVQFYPISQYVFAGKKFTSYQITSSSTTTCTSQSFISIRLLGTGGFGTVDEVVHRETSLRFARKTLKNRETSAMEELKNEVNVLKKLRHPHIIRFLGAYSTGDKVSILVSPVAETTLAAWLDRFVLDKPTSLSQTIIRMFGCLVSSVRYLHEQRPIVKHCDIKPQNILVTQGDQDFPHVVLCDFGISSSEEWVEGQPKPLTRHYCAPEIPEGISREQAADIWSLGCVFAEMASVPFSEENRRWLDFRQEFSGRKGKYYWQDVTSLHDWLSELLGEANNLMEKTVVATVKSMLDPTPAERPTAVSLTMVFTPAPCCLNWANNKSIFPRSQEELSAVEMFAHADGIDCCAQLHVHDAADEQKTQPFAHAKNWLDECSQDHEACHLPDDIEKSLPTRLVDINPDETGDPEAPIRVINTALIDQSSTQTDYAAICHVWSPTDLTLTTDRLQMMQSGLPRKTLPKIINEAISAAQRIGYRYVWVDSLCILQDSEEDKQQECAAMASVYRNAALTIVLDQLQSQPYNSCQVKDNHGARSLPGTTSTSTIEIKRYQQPTVAASASLPIIDFLTPAFAWDTRAWCLQERLLSRRILHLGQEQMYWECNSLKASETFPRGLPPLVWEKVHTKATSTDVAPQPLHNFDMELAHTEGTFPAGGRHAPSPRRLRKCQWIKQEGDGIGDSMEAAQITLQVDRSSSRASLGKSWSDPKPSRSHLKQMRQIRPTAAAKAEAEVDTDGSLDCAVVANGPSGSSELVSTATTTLYNISHDYVARPTTGPGITNDKGVLDGGSDPILEQEISSIKEVNEKTEKMARVEDGSDEDEDEEEEEEEEETHGGVYPGAIARVDVEGDVNMDMDMKG